MARGLENIHMRLLKADEVAEALQVPKPRVYEFARQHALPAVRIGRQLRFRQEAIETWLAALEDHGAVHAERL